jgi:hypothetical protein
MCAFPLVSKSRQLTVLRLKHITTVCWIVLNRVSLAGVTLALALAVGQMWTAPAVASTVTMFNLKGVTFQDGGSATGSFIIDLVDYSSPQLISVNITTTRGTDFAGTTYQVLYWFYGQITGDPGEQDGQSAFLLGITNASRTASLTFSFLNPLSTTTPTPLFLGLHAYPGESFQQSAGPPPVYAVRPLSSGVLVPISFNGMPGKANCYGQSVAALARQYSGLNAAAAALGYASVKALQEAIEEFCEG